MTYIYIDESGDLGFGPKGSEYFILAAAVITDDDTNKCFRRISKKVRQRILGKKTKRTSELKFSNSNHQVRKKFLEYVSKLNIGIYSFIVDKRYVKNDLKNNIPVLYKYGMKILLEKPLSKIADKNEIIIYIDKSLTSKERQNFEEYVKTEFLHIFKKIPKVEIFHESSIDNGGLQGVDFICGAFGHKYNTAKLGKDCDQYTKMIKNKIIVERNNFFKKTTNPAYSSQVTP